jgi:hypothetical protein
MVGVRVCEGDVEECHDTSRCHVVGERAKQGVVSGLSLRPLPFPLHYQQGYSRPIPRPSHDPNKERGRATVSARGACLVNSFWCHRAAGSNCSKSQTGACTQSPAFQLLALVAPPCCSSCRRRRRRATARRARDRPKEQEPPPLLDDRRTHKRTDAAGSVSALSESTTLSS